MVIKKIFQIYRTISTYTIKFILPILKNQMQETLDTVIGKHLSEVITNKIILHTLSTICDICYLFCFA